ncbi:hypothetical protein J3A83DRAFT_4433487 [Scleroderma citrinum]
MAERPRRAKGGSDKFAEYKRAREGGPRNWKVEEDVALYDEVTEDQYKSIVRGRLQRDDFVVDDGVSGYMDNGMDDWDQQEADEEDDEEEHYSTKKSRKAGDSAAKPKKKPKAPPPAAKPSISAYRPVVSAEQEEDFMANLLGGIEAAPIPAPKRARKRKPSPLSDYDNTKPDRSSSPIPYRERKTSTNFSYDAYSSDGPPEDIGPSNLPSSDFEDYAAIVSPKKKARVEHTSTAITPAIRRMNDLTVHSGSEDASMDFDDIDMDGFLNTDDTDVKPNPFKKDQTPPKLDLKAATKGSTATKEDTSAPAWLPIYDSLAVTTEDILGSGSSSSKSKTSVDALSDDGSLSMYWLDYLEHSGKLYLIGKVKDKSSGAWVSACLAIGGIQRNVFVLPRQLRVLEEENEAGESEIVETDVVPDKQDVYDDFDRIRRKMSIKSWKARWVKRKYAFDMKDVPKEADWMKVLYSFEEPQIPMDACSPNIHKIFGTNTSIFELFVLKRKIMGPCWLVIKNVNVDPSGISWCKLEASVSDPKDVSLAGDGAPEPPPLTVMSLAVRTVLNHQENNREIVCVSSRIWRDVQLDDPTPPEQLKCTVHTFVRPLDRFPPNFEARAKANGRSVISPMQNERMLLNSLLVTIYKADPDILIGHDFLGVSLDVLLSRMKEVKADHWSRLGRFRRAKWIPIGRQGTNIKFLAGRMLCDLASDGARSMIASTTWSLTEMCKSHLKSDRQDIDPDETAMYFDGSVSNPDMLMTFVRHCELDAHYQMAIASKVQILPLTKQLTNLAGNAWNKTMNGGRAERNEYILLHEFHRLKYICPDKTFGKKAFKPEPDADEDGDAGGKGGKAKRDKYKGGLVFEPKRGLWDKYILVMDFNSLYPSIIQEWNIDFTTVERSDNDADDTIPEPPGAEVPQGVLPRLIATLVQRRRQVKSLMKDRSITHAKLLQYDIKQQALKLTANSMYGCLGFEYSRFYARPLAALTTFKGREILTHTRELAESLQLDVVYGDTDSVFVNSNVTELSEALKISVELKKAVNERYKLLEIDLDGVFARLLLLQKKKYAALKVEDGTRTSVEVKGLDMKRREYCALSKNVSQYVLDQILSGEATEVVVENIHEYLSTIGSNVRGGKIKLEEFIIFKRLGKNPEDYPDAKSQPHVQVALRMKAKGGSAKAGDVIPYVFCVGKGEEASKGAQADRAKHPDELKKAAPGELSIDYEHYLSNQILPPIERLCEPIEGTDRARLAECLGLDPGRYRVSGGGEGPAFATLDSQISDAERFKDCQPFFIRCRGCKGEGEFRPIWERESSVLQHSGPACLGCGNKYSTASLATQLEVQIRVRIAQYYQGWLICDDSTCANRTRSMGVYGRRCIKPGCRGTARFEYSDVDLYNQLRYFQSLFDPEKSKKAAIGSPKFAEVKDIAENSHCRVFLEAMAGVVDRYIDRSGRRWVDLGVLFGGMKL